MLGKGPDAPKIHKNSLQFRVHAISDTGCVRHNNEDAWAAYPDSHLFVLADGMGGHLAGEVASLEAVHFFSKTYLDLIKKWEDPTPEQVAFISEQALEAANSHVFYMSRTDKSLQGMGTTLCALTFCGSSAIILHVGDSRIYRLRQGNLAPLTEDHSLRAELLNGGNFNERELEALSCRHVLTRAVGTTEYVEPAITIQPAFPQDLYLLCSDGLTDMLTDNEIKEILALPRTIEERVRTLVVCAKEHGGHDNITLVLVEVT